MAKYGQSTSNESLPVVLSTEQELLLENLQNISTTEVVTTQISSASGAGQNLIFIDTDTTPCNYISFQLSGSWGAIVSFQGSNDNVTFYPVLLEAYTSTSSIVNVEPKLVSSTSSNGLFRGNIAYRYFKVVISAFVLGTVSCSYRLYKTDKNPIILATYNTPAAKTVTNTINASGSSITYDCLGYSLLNIQAFAASSSSGNYSFTASNDSSSWSIITLKDIPSNPSGSFWIFSKEYAVTYRYLKITFDSVGSGAPWTINAYYSNSNPSGDESLGIGSPSDAAATSDTQNTGLIGLTKRLLSRLTTLLPQADNRLVVDGSQVTQPVSLASLPLPSGAATDLTLQQVRDAIKAQIDLASTIWTDNSGVYYVRRDLVNEGTGAITVAFTLADGTTATPGAGLKPLSTADRDVLSAYYDVITNGTGYSVGDLLARIAILDVNAATPSSTFIWLNLTTGAVISSPTAAHIERADETTAAKQSGTWTVSLTQEGTGITSATMPSGGAGFLGWLSAIWKLISDQQTTLAAIAKDGTDITGVTMPSGGANVRGWLSAIWKLIGDRLPTLGQKTSANSISVVQSSDGYTLTGNHYLIDMPTQDQEYNLTINNAQIFSIRVVSGGSIRYAYTSGKVSTSTHPYYPMSSVTEDTKFLPTGARTSLTLYVASSTPNTKVVVEVWS